MKIQYGYERCPACDADLDGGMIPVERRGIYNGAERYSNLEYRNWNVDGEFLLCPNNKCRSKLPVRPPDLIR